YYSWRRSAPSNDKTVDMAQVGDREIIGADVLHACLKSHARSQLSSFIMPAERVPSLTILPRIAFLSPSHSRNLPSQTDLMIANHCTGEKYENWSMLYVIPTTWRGCEKPTTMIAAVRISKARNSQYRFAIGTNAKNG